MQEYDMYPTTGRFFPFKEPEEQKKRKHRSAKDTLEQLPLLKKVVEHLDERIAFYASVDSIATDLDKDPNTHRNIMAANRVVRDELKRERMFIQAEIDKATR